METLTAQICPRVTLCAAEIDSMFQIFRCYYEETSREMFEEDLSNKLDVILLRGEDGAIRGFSTLSVIAYDDHGLSGRAIFSGDTIIQHEHWGSQALPLAFASYAASVKSANPDEPLFWFLISKGHRTYRYLPLLFHDYYPRYEAFTPPTMQRVMNLLAEKKFGDHYDSATGVVRFPNSRGQLRTEWAGVPLPALRKPEVRFFLERNPGYAHGHELVCLAELSVQNLRSVGRRRFEETLQMTLP